MCRTNFKVIIMISLIVLKVKSTIALSRCLYAKDICPNPHVKFWLYKNETRQQPKLLDPLQLEAADFQPMRPLKILLHGYIGYRDFSPNTEIRPVLLQTQPVHVVSIDYGYIVRGPCYYPWSVANAPIVAKCLAQFINNLIAKGIYDTQDIHIIGFSLGGQIAGLTANYVHSKLHRITGLDPARPGYVTTDRTKKLDATDATFVDVIHTDFVLFGNDAASGHADFYPNFKRSSQPGCNPLHYFNMCDHFRAPKFYAESIVSELNFWSHPCGTTLEFSLKDCEKYENLPPVLMGYFTSENASGSYFLTTNAVPPYARGQTQMSEVMKPQRKLQRFGLFW